MRLFSVTASWESRRGRHRFFDFGLGSPLVILVVLKMLGLF